MRLQTFFRADRTSYFVWTGIFLTILFFLFSRWKTSTPPQNTLIFVTCADYPPFEYMTSVDNKALLTGLDIELARLLAKEMKKEAVFLDMSFANIFQALQEGRADIAISTLTPTLLRRQHFDFSQPYHDEGLALMFRKDTPLADENDWRGRQLGCQMGSTMDMWIKEQDPLAAVMAFDQTHQAIEALKSGHVGVVVIDAQQAKVFGEKNPQLSYLVVTSSSIGYCLAFPKNSVWERAVNMALTSLTTKGDLQKLKEKWLHSSTQLMNLSAVSTVQHI